MAEHPIALHRYHTIRASLVYTDPGRAVNWYKQALDAEEYLRVQGADGQVIRSELSMGGSALILSPAYGENRLYQQKMRHRVFLHLFVDDVVSTLKKAVKNGARLIMKATDQLNGELAGIIKDPFGYTWTLGSLIREKPDMGSIKLN